MATRRVIIDGREQIDPRSTWAWRRLKTQVVREEPRCWLKMDVCLGRSDTADHIIPVKDRPDLAMVRANLRGACGPCNRKRRDLPADLFTPPQRWVM